MFYEFSYLSTTVAIHSASATSSSSTVAIPLIKALFSLNLISSTQNNLSPGMTFLINFELLITDKSISLFSGEPTVFRDKKQLVWAMHSIISTPGMIGLPGK